MRITDQRLIAVIPSRSNAPVKIACSTTVATMKPLEEALAFIARLGFSSVDLLLAEGWAHRDPSDVAADPARHAAAESAFNASIEALRRVVDVAGPKGITIAVETHSGSLAETYNSALRFVSAVPGLKLAYDPSPFVKANLGIDESRVLIPHAAHVHVRNAMSGNIQAHMAEGSLDFALLFEALDAAKYSRTISIEYLDNRDEDILADVVALKALLDTRYSHI